MKRIIVFLITLVFIACGCGGKTSQNGAVTETGFQLDTLITVSLYDCGDEAVFADVFDEIERLERLLSRKRPGSDLDRLARGAGQGFVPVSPDVIFLLEEGGKHSRLTGGLFDVTVGPLVSLWDIGEGSGHFPTSDELSAAMELIDYEEALTDGNTARLGRAGMEADFGAIAKGYIADKVKELLLQRGVKSGLVNLGGNVILIGGKPDGGDFRIGIKDPDGEMGEYMGIVETSDKSLVTSGPYERFFVHDGIAYHHILNPKTGFPEENGLLQVTIISDDSVTGDALSTGAFLLGLENGMKLVNGIPGVSAIFVTDDKKIWLSDGFDEIFNITSAKYTFH